MRNGRDVGAAWRVGTVLLAFCAGTAWGQAAADPVQVFLTECGQRGTALLKEDKMAVAGRDGWIFLATELRHLGAGKFWGPEAETASTASSAKDPMPAILDTFAQLKALGVEMLLAPVPPRTLVYAEKLTSTAVLGDDGRPARADPHHRAFYAALRGAGVPVLDLTDDFLAARASDAEDGPVFCRHDTHWSPRGCELAAEKVYEAVTGRPWLAGISRRAYVAETNEAQIAGDLWMLLNSRELPRETIAFRRVGEKKGAGLTPIECDEKSPILLLADSHGLVFHDGGDMHAKDAGMVDHLALRFGFSLDRIARRGSAATSIRIDLARRAYQEKDYWKSKKLVIWCLAAREFTESSWRNVPLTRKEQEL
jgi:alginate O-acetyltransferase complex protein AlgJ